MRKFEVSELLEIKLKKLFRKDKPLYLQVMKKINEIINAENIDHYKNLRYNLKDSKRVHIGHFVLVFRNDKNTDSLIFDDFDHHDKIYL